jgi:hypothetical protein
LFVRSFQQLIGVQDEDSCGRSGQCETPQERSDEEAHRSPAESEVLHGNQLRYSKPISIKPGANGFYRCSFPFHTNLHQNMR